MSLWDAMAELGASGEPFCCVTVVEATGSVPQDPGAKMLVTAAGRVDGTVGGGKIEARAVAHAQELLNQSSGSPELLRWNLQTDLGMTCGGLVSLLFEVQNAPRWRIAIFGAGHVAQSVTRILLPLDCHLTCFDTRGEWLEKLPKESRLRRVLSEDPAAEVGKLSPGTFVLVMTMGHATDLPILREVITREFPYVGVIGSKSKAASLRRALLREGFEEEQVAKFYCPMGLDIGSNHLQEIAISVAGQLLEVRDRGGASEQ